MKKKLQTQKATLFIQGMHCPSCDILVKDKFCELRNVKGVKADYKNQTAEISYVGTLDKKALNDQINHFGYSVAADEEELVHEPISKRITEASALAIILFIVYYFVQDFKILPDIGAGASALTLITVFILGMIASTSTCMATSGALFLATIGKLKSSVSKGQKNENWSSTILPAISFNVGRVLSYGVFGFIVGMIGKALTGNIQLEIFLNLFVSAVMILIGLDMLKLFSFSWVTSTPFTKGIFQKLEAKFIKKPRQTAFLLGAITYLLPCGFTQSVQIYALGQADPIKSSLIMMIFALGTVPALLAVGFASSFTKNSYFALFQKAMGVIVFMIGVSSILGFASLRGLSLSEVLGQSTQSTQLQNVQVENGIQVIRMSVDSKGYSPNTFTIKEGQPVKWEIEGKNVFGCQSTLVAPKLGIAKAISLGSNSVEFTPHEKGMISFSCPMNMYTGNINVI